MVMFLFLVIALAVVVAAVTLAVVGGGESDGPLPDVTPERLQDPLPPDRPYRGMRRMRPTPLPGRAATRRRRGEIGRAHV